jgi:3-dehydroquinate synthase
MAIFHVPLTYTVDDSYDIEIGENLFPILVKDVKAGILPGAHRYALITDSNVTALYGEKLLGMLKAEGLTVEIFSFRPGERHKTRTTKARLEDKMIAAHFGRDSAVIALGGGVVSDLAGFLAGTFGRGIPFVNYSSTLLAAADASIGGKTAVDTPEATNLIGLFHQPKKVYIDISLWDTLPECEIRNGLAETVKHACLGDCDFFVYLEKNIEKIMMRTDSQNSLNREVSAYIAARNCEIKYRVVAEDVRETNRRQVLNLGHTLGRALEPLTNYMINHGEAIAIGLVFQMRLGLASGYVSAEDFSRVRSLLSRVGLPIVIPPMVKIEHLIEKMRTDKKVRKDEIRFVFQKGIGAMMRFEDGSYSRPVSENELIQALKDSY